MADPLRYHVKYDKLGHGGDNLCGQRKVRSIAAGAAGAAGSVKLRLKCSKLGGVGLGGIDDDMRGRLKVGDGHGNSLALPAELLGLGGLVDGGVRALGWRRRRTVDEVDLVAVVGAVDIVADERTI